MCNGLVALRVGGSYEAMQVDAGYHWTWFPNIIGYSIVSWVPEMTPVRRYGNGYTCYTMCNGLIALRVGGSYEAM